MWQCTKCREQVEETFEVCWNCGTSRDGVADPSFQRADEEQADGPEAESVAEAIAVKPTPAQPAPRKQAALDCPKCGARQVIPAVRVLDRDGEYADKGLSLRLDRNPEAWIFKGSEVVELKAKVCGRCGYTELYAANPEAIWAAYREQE